MPGLWEAVLPQAAINLVTNPSPQRSINGYTAKGTGCTIAQTYEQQRRGAASLKVNVTSGANDGVYYSLSLTSGLQYTFDVDVYGANGVPYRIYFADNSGNLLGSATTFTGLGYWQPTRIAVTYTATATATHRLVVEKNNSTNTTAFYVDGFYLRVGAGGDTYVDGSQPGCLWDGAPYASTSSRSEQTREGGLLVNLDAYYTIVKGSVGLGRAPVRNVLIPYGQSDGAYFQRTKLQERAFSLALITGGSQVNSLNALHLYKKQLEALFNQRLTAEHQPTWLRYGGAGVSAGGVARPMWIKALYDAGDEFSYMATDDSAPGFVDKTSIKFVAPDPLLYEDGKQGANLAFRNNLGAWGKYLLRRSASGTWSWPGSGANGLVWKTVYNPVDGRFYIAGAFTSVDGVANTSRVCAYNPVTGAIEALGTGGSGSGTVYALDVAPNGDVWVGGSQGVTFGGVANTNGLARWSLSAGAWQAVSSSGISSGSIVYAIHFTTRGTVFLGGTFTSVGATSAARIAFSTDNGANWNAIGSGCNSTVYALASNLDGTIVYAGGAFGTFNGVTCTNIGQYNTVTAVVSAMGSGANGTILSLLMHPSGLLYIAGQQTTLGGITVNYIGTWNGTGYGALSTGANAAVNRLGLDPHNNVWCTGNFTTLGGLPISYIGVWNGSSFAQSELLLGSSAITRALDFAPNGLAIVGWDATLSGIVAAETTSVTNRGSAEAQEMTFVFYGPGTLSHLRNFTTGNTIWFGNLTLKTGDIATLTISPAGVLFSSLNLGNLLGYILPGSTLSSFRLLPGVNNLNAFISANTDGNTKLTAEWRVPYLSLHGAGA